MQAALWRSSMMCASVNRGGLSTDPASHVLASSLVSVGLRSEATRGPDGVQYLKPIGPFGSVRGVMDELENAAAVGCSRAQACRESI